MVRGDKESAIARLSPGSPGVVLLRFRAPPPSRVAASQRLQKFGVRPVVGMGEVLQLGQLVGGCRAHVSHTHPKQHGRTNGLMARSLQMPHRRLSGTRSCFCVLRRTPEDLIGGAMMASCSWRTGERRCDSRKAGLSNICESCMFMREGRRNMLKCGDVRPLPYASSPSHSHVLHFSANDEP